MGRYLALCFMLYCNLAYRELLCFAAPTRHSVIIVNQMISTYKLFTVELSSNG